MNANPCVAAPQIKKNKPSCASLWTSVIMGQLPEHLKTFLSIAGHYSDKQVIFTVSLLALPALHSDVIAAIWSLVNSLTLPMPCL